MGVTRGGTIEHQRMGAGRGRGTALAERCARLPAERSRSKKIVKAAPRPVGRVRRSTQLLSDGESGDAGRRTLGETREGALPDTVRGLPANFGHAPARFAQIAACCRRSRRARRARFEFRVWGSELGRSRGGKRREMRGKGGKNGWDGCRRWRIFSFFDRLRG